MAFSFLWVETLALAFIFIAFIYRLSSPSKKRFLRIPVRVLAFLVPFLLGGAFIVIAWYIRKNNLDAGWMFGYSLFWLICMLVGFAFVRKYARENQVTGEETCLSWRLMTMAGAFGIILSLTFLTYLKMDADARARLDAAQARALALATLVTPEPLPWEQNAARFYDKAGKEIKLPSWSFKINNSGFMPSVNETEKIVEKNRNALLLIKRASTIPNASFVSNPGVDRAWPSFWAEMPKIGVLRDSVRLLALDCYVKAAQGKTSEALECIESMAAAARHCSRDPYLLSTLVAGSIIQVQTSSLERLLALAPSWDRDFIPLPVENRSPIAGLWQRSLLMSEATMLYSMSFDLSTDRLYGGGIDINAETLLFYVLPYRALMSKYDLAFFEKAYQKNHEFASKPIYEVYRKQKEWEKTVMEKPGGFFSAIAGVPALSGMALKPHTAEAQSGLMNLALAATAFYAGTGDYPRSLKDLIPDYIREIPLDPFDGNPLKMRAVDRGMVLYSIGPDFKDDGGKTQYPLTLGKDKSGDLLFRIGAAYDQAFLATSLPQLAASGNTDMVRRALAVGGDVSLDASLVEAALMGHNSVVSLLLESGADINALKETEIKRIKKKGRPARAVMPTPKWITGGVTALIGACMNKHPDTAGLLLEKDADPNRANKKGRTALMLAAGKGLLNAMAWTFYEMQTLDETKKEIQVLKAKIGELEGKESDEAEKKLEIIKVRLDRAKRRVEHLQSEKAPSGKPAPILSPAAGDQGREALVQLLLDAGADMHAKDRLDSTALHFAVYQGDKDAANLLIAKGADINARNKIGWTPLVIAKATGNGPMETLLTGAGASMKIADEKIVNRLSNSLSRLQAAQKGKKKTRRR